MYLVKFHYIQYQLVSSYVTALCTVEIHYYCQMWLRGLKLSDSTTVQ